MNTKLKAYYRNQFVANFILIGSLLLMGLFLFLQAKGNHSRLLDIFSYLTEAILIASVADFIAIFALSKPILGLNFTGLIQNKRKEIIHGFVSACETRILPKKKIIHTARGYDIVRVLKLNLNDSNIHDRAPLIGKSIANFIKCEEKSLSLGIAWHIFGYIAAIDSGRFVTKMEIVAREKGWINSVVRAVFDKLQAVAKKDDFVNNLECKIRNAVKDYIQGEKRGFWESLKRKGRGTKIFLAEAINTINYQELSQSIADAIKEVLKNLQKLQSEDKRWQEMEYFLSSLILKLATNRPFNDTLKQWKKEALKDEDFAPLISVMLRTVADWLEDDTLTSEEIKRSLKICLIDNKVKDINISEWLTKILLNGLHALKQNDEVVQTELTKLIEEFIHKEYKSILDIIRDVLSKLSAQGLVEKVNEVAGGNLQWLRISGAYVGLIAGLSLYAVTRWPLFGLPIFTVSTLAITFVRPIRQRLVVISVDTEAG